MHCREYGRDPVRLDRTAAVLGDAKVLAEESLRGRRSEADDDLRLQLLELLVQPREARPDLAVARLLVDPALRALALLPLEVLHGVGDVDVAAIDLGRLERAVEQAPGRPDERATL